MQEVASAAESPAEPAFGLAGLRQEQCLKLVEGLWRLGVATTTRRYESG